MEDQTILQNPMQEDSFEVVMRGYNKRQVDDYVLQCQHHIRDLAQRLALAEQEIERVRTDAAAAIERVSAKPVHEEVSERLSQILRLATEEAERERAKAAEEIAALRARTLADTQNLREQAQRESDALRQQVEGETDALRRQVQHETDSLRDRVEAESSALREQTIEEATQALELARSESDRVLTSAHDTAERDLDRAHTEVDRLREEARVESERLVRTAQERSDTLVEDAERRANAINTILGARLEVLTSTHRDVVGRLNQLRSTLADSLGKEESLGAFAIDLPPTAVPAPMSSGYSPSGAGPSAYSGMGQSVGNGLVGTGSMSLAAGPASAVRTSGQPFRDAPTAEPYTFQSASIFQVDSYPDGPLSTAGSADSVRGSRDDEGSDAGRGAGTGRHQPSGWTVPEGTSAGSPSPFSGRAGSDRDESGEQGSHTAGGPAEPTTGNHLDLTGMAEKSGR